MKNHILIIALVVIVVILFGIVYFSTLPRSFHYNAPSPSLTPSMKGDDTTSAINTDLQQLDLGEVDGAFHDIDQSLNSL